MNKKINTKHDISDFLTHTLGGITEGYVLALAELMNIKEQQNKKLSSQLEQLQKELNQSKEIINALNKQHEETLQKIQNQLQLEQTQAEKQKNLEKQSNFFSDSSVKIVTDKKTKLMWAVNANQKDNFPNPNKSISWYEIKSWITSVNEKGYGGFNDWRLPTQKELSTLLLAKPVNQCWLDKNLFFDTQWKDKLIYWTSSTQSIVGLSKPHVYLVNFNLGFCYTGTPQNTYQLRLVRSI